MAHSPIAEAPPWHSLSHRKSKLPDTLPPGKASAPTGHWAWPPVLEALTCGDSLCFSAGEHALPLPGLAQGQTGQGELALWGKGLAHRLAPLPAGRLGPAAAWTSSKAQQGPLWGGSLPESLS